MGLDAMMLVMALEDEFKMEISEYEAQTVGHVGEMYELILRKLGPQYAEQLFRARQLTRPVVDERLHESYQRTRGVFYRLRRALAEILERPAREIRPSTSLASLLSEPAAEAVWKRLARHTRLRLLLLPRALGFGCGMFVILALGWLLVLFFATASFSPKPPAYFAPLYLAGCLVFLILSVATARHRGRLDRQAWLAGMTMRELTHQVDPVDWLYQPRRRKAAAGAAEQLAELEQDEVWLRLRAVIVRELMVKPREVTPQAHFRYDLGAG